MKTLKEINWQLEQPEITTAEKIYWKQEEYKTLQEIKEREHNIDVFLSYKPNELNKVTFNKVILEQQHKIQDLVG